jgi:hypothetical protein
MEVCENALFQSYVLYCTGHLLVVILHVYSEFSAVDGRTNFLSRSGGEARPELPPDLVQSRSPHRMRHNVDITSYVSSCRHVSSSISCPGSSAGVRFSHELIGCNNGVVRLAAGIRDLSGNNCLAHMFSIYFTGRLTRLISRLNMFCFTVLNRKEKMGPLMWHS